MVQTEASHKDNGGGSLGLPIFLAVAVLLQLIFIWAGARAIRTTKSAPTKTKGVALVALAFADLVWAAACFLHCIMNYKLGRFWGGKAGCDAQGYYSTLACLSTMALTVQISWVTWVVAAKGDEALPSPTKMAMSSIGLYCVTLLLAAVPFLSSTGGFVYTAEGFCFIDYYDDAISVIFLIALVLSLGAVWVLAFKTRAAIFNPTAKAEVYSKDTSAADDDGAAKLTLGYLRKPRLAANVVILCAAFFTLYYVLGFPLIIQGFLRDKYADKLQISSGILAHGAEIINPIIYGVVWLSLFANTP